MVRVFIGAKEAKKEDLGNYEIKDEKVKRIFAEALARKIKEDRRKIS